MNGKRMYELLEKMNYVRVGGTEEEKKTAELLQAECASVGLEAKIEEFEIEDGELGECYFEVTEPYQKSYEMRAYKRCASVEAEAEIYYVTCRNLNVRAGGSTSYKKVDMIHRGDAVKVLEIKNGWAKLDNGTWVCAKYIAK